MKGRSSSPDSRKRTTHRVDHDRLIERAPVIYLGPDARDALGGGKGLLLGSKRSGWVDVLAFERRAGEKIKGLVGLRFDWRSENHDIVGIVISPEEFERTQKILVRDLVPGDIVLISEEGVKKKKKAYVHLGGGLGTAKLKVSRAISARAPRA